MRKGVAHSARRKRSKTGGRRGHDAGAFLLALGVFGAMGLAATYDFTREQKPQAAATAPPAAIASGQPSPIPSSPIPTGALGAVAREAIEPITRASTTPLISAPVISAPLIEEQISKKEDRLITGSLPAPGAIAPPAADLKAPSQAEKKKKPVTTTAKAAPKPATGLFLTGQTLSPPN